MKALYELKEKFEMELEELARKGELGAGDLELAHKLTDTIKNIDKICALEEDGGYSGDSYSRGSSYRRRHYVRGHYSRDGYSGDRGGGYSRDGGYSRHNAKDQMMAQMEELLGRASNERDRQAIQRCMEQMENE